MKVNFRKLQKHFLSLLFSSGPLHPQFLIAVSFCIFFLSFASVEVQSEKFLFLQFSGISVAFLYEKGWEVERIEIACEVYFQGANKWVENKRWQCCWWFGCRENSLKDASVQEKMASFQQVYRSHRTIVLGVLILPLQHFIANESVCKVGFYYHSIEHRFENKRCCDQNSLKRFRLFLFSKICLNFSLENPESC